MQIRGEITFDDTADLTKPVGFCECQIRNLSTGELVDCADLATFILTYPNGSFLPCCEKHKNAFVSDYPAEPVIISRLTI